MRQVQLTAYGSADNLRLIDTPTPQPGPGELLIQVEASGVNYADILRRRNTYFQPTPLPYVLGTEAVGTVVAVGDGIAQPPSLGTRVLAILPHSGGYAEYVCASAKFCVPLPPHVSAADATALFVQGSTAHLIVHHAAPDLAGKTVLVHAAAGGVGSLLVQLATQAGARVIAAASSDAKLERAQAFGAVAGVNYRLPEWPVAVVAANGGQRVDVILETIGGEIFSQSLKCLRPGGTMVVYGAASGEQGQIESERLVDNNWTLTSFNLAHYIETQPSVWQASLGAMIGLLAEGGISIDVQHQFPLAQAQDAHAAIEQRLTVGKVVLIP